ncbi:unnamed protein product [Paramecium pentaurelia]|uniref:Uncharacterized protein n=1 Tax=Paramecium pentaurelia TaxID=43138 RepID=A0A8S1SG61_9CILI|nr:unnamed protein product [Paramecium pentaurelia]
MRTKSCLPEISFKDYCQKYLNDSFITSERQTKNKFKLDEMKSVQLGKEKQLEFQNYIKTAIDQTKQVRIEATKEATKTFGNPKQWLRAQKEYFKQPEEKHKTYIECYQFQMPTQINFNKWKYKERLEQIRYRSYSVRKTPNSQRRQYIF